MGLMAPGLFCSHLLAQLAVLPSSWRRCLAEHRASAGAAEASPPGLPRCHVQVKGCLGAHLCLLFFR